MAVCIASITTVEKFGINQRKNGSRNREVCSADIASVDAEKIKIIQTSSGSHKLANFLIVIP